MRIKTTLTSIILVFLCSFTFAKHNVYHKTVFKHHIHSRIVTASNFSLLSPDNNIEIKISTTPNMKYSVLYHGKEIIAPSTIAMTFDNGIKAGIAPKFSRAEESENEEYIDPIFKKGDTRVEDFFNQLSFYNKAGYMIIFRAYNDGIAYRFITYFDQPVNVSSETDEFNFNANYNIYFPLEYQMYSLAGQPYSFSPITSLKKANTIPTLINAQDNLKLMISEADLDNYPAMLLQRNDSVPFGFKGAFIPSSSTSGTILAHTDGSRSFPWRAIIISDTKDPLPQSNILYKLSISIQIPDYHWIKEGVIAYDEQNLLPIYKDSSIQSSTINYKTAINNASQKGYHFFLLKEDWNSKDQLNPDPSIDLNELVKFASGKKIDLILPVSENILTLHLAPFLEQLVKWKIAGIKVNFQGAPDQKSINFYHHIAEVAAQHHLLIDYYGTYKPTGLHRTFPNFVSFEENILSKETVK